MLKDKIYIISSFSVNSPKEWLQSKEPVFTATALYDFTAASTEELSLKTGQKVWLAPQSLQPKNLPGWWRATDTINVGLVPSTYVTVVGQLKKKSDSNQVQAPSPYQPIPVVENLPTEQESSESQIINEFNKEQDDSFAKSKSEDIFEVKDENN